MNINFLKEFIDEDIYIIKEANSEKPSKSTNTVDSYTSENEVEKIQDAEESYINDSLNYLGETKSGVAILLEVKETLDYGDSDIKFLSKVLQAVNIDIKEVALVNIKENNNLSLALLKSENLVRCLSFTDNSLISTLSLYQATEVEHVTLLRCDTLKAISTDVELKKSLWSALKSLFTI